MFTITMQELKRNCFNKAFTEGYQLFTKNIFPYNNIASSTEGTNRKIYYGRCLDNDQLINTYVAVSSNDKIVAYHCECSDVGHYVGGMCSHVVALCLSVIKNFQNDEIILDSTDKQNIFLSLKEDEDKRRLVALEFRKNKELEKQKEYYNDLLKKYDRNQGITILKEKIKVIPMITYSRNIELSLKVGIDNYYIVRNIQMFLNQIMNKEYVSYGKKLSFYHTLENFDEPSQKLLHLLLTQSRYSDRRSYYGSDKKITVNYLFVDEIFKIYANRIIKLKLDYYDSEFEDALILDKPYPIEISLNNQGVLSINKELEDCYTFKGYSQDYLYTKQMVFLLDKRNKDLAPLIEHLLEYQSLDISGTMEDFLSNLYPRIYQTINVDEEFKNTHPLKEVVIDSYLSLENNNIELDNHYFLDNEELEYGALKEKKVNQFKLNEYFKMITNIGFELKEEKYIISGIERVVEFLRMDLSNLKQFGEVYLSDNLKRVSINKMRRGNVNVSYNVDMLSIVFDDFGYSDEELSKILSAYKSKKKFVKLSKDRIVEIDEEVAADMSSIIEALAINPKHFTKAIDLPIYQSLALDNENYQNITLNVDQKIKEIIEKIKDFKNSDYSVSEHFEEVLRPYQIEAYQWLKILTEYKFGGVLADEMGLGKTLEMIALIAADTSTKPSLIVCPKSLTFNWLNEIRKWASSLKVEVIYGTAHERLEKIKNIESHKKQIFVTSYDSLRNDVEEYLTKDFRFIVLDEGQFIKNTTALKTQAVKRLNGEVRFVLTGTPIENALADLWSIFDFILPGFLSTYNNFKEKYEQPIINYDSSETLFALTKKVAPFILRRTKKDVLKDLPDKTETIHYAFMEDEQRKLYEGYLLKTRNELQQVQSKIQVLSMLTRLRQICVEPRMFIEDYQGESCKLILGMELIKDYIANNHKILIFSQFKSMFPYLEKLLDESNIDYFKLTGATSSSDRIRLVDKFNSDRNVKVFLISLKAGGTGLNLTGADVVIHFDPWWNVSAENQATDRAHRIGQIHNVEVVKIICANSIEQKVLELQDLKKELSAKVISDNEESIIKLEQSDYKFILS